MNDSDQLDSTAPKRGWISKLFKWVDSFESESQKKTIQGVIQGLILATIIGIATFIYKEHEAIGSAIAGGGKSIVGQFQQSVKIQLWVVALVCGIIASLLGALYGLHTRKNSKEMNSQIVKLSAAVKENQKSYALKYIVVDFIRDETKVRGLNEIVEKGYSSVYDAAELFLLSERFIDFIGKMDMALAIVDTSDRMDISHTLFAISFVVASRETAYKDTTADVMLEKHAGITRKLLTMNQSAFNYYDLAYTNFRKQNGLD